MLKMRFKNETELKGKKAAIYLTKINYSVFTNRKWVKLTANKIVAKGTEDQITKCKRVKRRVLEQFFSSHSAAKNKIATYDLEKIRIDKITVLNFLGYGTKRE
jgi:hypothetical protein